MVGYDGWVRWLGTKKKIRLRIRYFEKTVYKNLSIISPGDTITLKVKRGDEFTGYEELEFSFEVNEKDEKELREFVNKMKQR